MIVDLIKTTALLFSLTLLYGVIIRRLPRKRLNALIASGCLFGLIAVSSMMMPVNFAPGVIFDPRSVIISLSGVFGGPIAAILSAVIAGSYRMWLGGAGAVAGTLVIVVCAVSGVGYYYLQKHFLTEIKYSHLFVFGIVTHFFSILSMVVLPSDLMWKVASNLAIPFFIIYPPITVFLGALILGLEKTVEMKEELEDSEKRLLKILDNLQNEIVERKQVEVKLIKNQYYLTKAQEIGSIGTWEMDIKRNTLIWTKENYKIFGVPPGTEMNYELFQNCVHPDDRDYVNEKWSAGLNKEPFDIEHRIIADGKIKWVREKADIEFDKEDNPLMAIGSTQDITDYKYTEEELRKYREHLEELVKERTSELEDGNKEILESQKAMRYLLEDVNEARTSLQISNESLERANRDMESFSYSVSHDLRAPLRSILGFSSILEERLGGTADKETLRLMSVISKNTIKMQTLISDLLNFSRIGRTEIIFNTVNMYRLVSEICTNYTENTDKNSMELRVLTLPDATGSYPMIKQVFINLIDNAVKFTRTTENPLITIGSQISEGITTYYVKDNGGGFDMKFSKKIFDIFARLHNKKSIEGTGVGLAIVKQIIERHGGVVWAESEPGKGASFYFTLSNRNGD